jgi:hypothetical protein
VDHLLLRSWLGLDPGPWPPDHYALLGLPPGVCDPTAVEAIVLDRMDRLREHQLRHPELATEGMNRLAQALICLTDPAARASYDASLGLVPTSDATVRDPELLLNRPPPLPAFVVVEEVEPLPLPPAYEVVWEDEPAKPPVYEIVGDVVEAKLVARPTGPWLPATRRELFARLAAVRRLLAAWQKLKPVLGDPRETLSRPAPVLILLEAAAGVRPALKPLCDVVGGPGQPGALVAALLAQPLLLPTFRLLLPDQRRAVALDWRRAELALSREYVRLRELVRSGRPVRPRAWRGFRPLKWLIRVPEVAVVLLAVAAIAVVWWRGRGGR